MCQQQYAHEIDERQEQVRDEFRQYYPERLDRGDEHELHCPHFLFLNDGHCGHHRAYQHEYQAHDARDEVVGRVHGRIVHQLHIRPHGCGTDSEHPLGKFHLATLQHAFDVVHHDLCGVRVRAVADYLDDSLALG